MANGYSKAYQTFKDVIANASRTTQFMIELPTLSGITTGSLTRDLDIVPEDINNKVVFTAKDIAIPSKSLGQLPIYYRGKQIKLPGDFNIGEFVITCYDTDKKEARRYFDTWFNTQFDSLTGTRGDVSQVKSDEIKIKIFNTEGLVESNTNESMTFTLIGAFVMNIGEDARDWEAIDAIANFPITMSIDDMDLVYHETATDAAGG